jgi:hypothetical protein
MQASPHSLNSFDLARFPDLYTRFTITPDSMYSATEFRSHGDPLLGAAASAPAPEPIPLLRDSSVWDRVADIRTSRGIRLLTLWESTRSTVSLQTGHGGGPSLQWTSRALGRGEGTHSLFDHLFSTTLDHAQPVARGGRSAPSSRPAHLFDKADDLIAPRHD